MKTIQTIITDKVHAEMLAEAKKDERSISFWVRDAIDRKLKSCKRRKSNRR